MSLHTTITKETAPSAVKGWWRIATYHGIALARETWHGGTKAEARQTAREQEEEMLKRGYR